MLLVLGKGERSHILHCVAELRWRQGEIVHQDKSDAHRIRVGSFSQGGLEKWGRRLRPPPSVSVFMRAGIPKTANTSPISPGSEPSVPPPHLYPHVYAAEKSLPEAYQKQPTKS